MKALLFIVLTMLATAEQSIDCPHFLKGLNYKSSDDDPTTYWHCPQILGSAKSIKKNCDNNQIYDPKLGDCRNGASKKGAKKWEQLEIEALTDVQHLGALYNCRTDTFPSGQYLWDVNPGQVVDQVKIRQPKEFSNLDVYKENDLRDRAEKMNMEEPVVIKILSQEVIKPGIAKYLQDEKSSSQTARVVMRYRSTREVEIIPLSTPISYPNYCNDAKSKGGVTHVVTGKVIGLRAFLKFDKDVIDDEKVEEASKKLAVEVESIPSFVHGQDGWTDDKGKVVESIDRLSVAYHGDVAISEIPSDYESAIAAFSEIEAAAQTGSAPVR